MPLLARRLAASILKCGKNRIWMDRNEHKSLALATTRDQVRALIKSRLIVKRAEKVHSRFRARKRAEAKRKGRHMGLGSRRGTKEARMPSSVLWRRRIRTLRNVLRKYRDTKKIDTHMYRNLYAKAKGNYFKSKRTLLEYIIKAKNERRRQKTMALQAEALREKVRANADKRLRIQNEKRENLLKQFEEEEKAFIAVQKANVEKAAVSAAEKSAPQPHQKTAARAGSKKSGAATRSSPSGRGGGGPNDGAAAQTGGTQRGGAEGRKHGPAVKTTAGAKDASTGKNRPDSARH